MAMPTGRIGGVVSAGDSPSMESARPARMNTLLFLIHPGQARKRIVVCSSRVGFCRRHKFSPSEFSTALFRTCAIT